MLKTMGLLALILVVALGILAASFPLQWWNISLADLRAKYETPQSRYLTIDGAQLHYYDEGNPNGVPVVLLHGNFGSLRTFDEWPPLLGGRYRVIRFDIPATGLSGFDTSGDYSIDRRIFLMNQLLDHLNVDRYFMVSTSFNGPTAFRAAAREPERVMGMVLGNAGGLPRTPETNPNQPESNPLRRWLFQYYRPKSFFDAAVPGLIPNPAKRGPETAEQFHLMVTAKGRSQEGIKILRQFDSRDAQQYLERITCPVLLQWTTKGEQRLLVDKDLVRFQAWLTNATVTTIEYDGAGHMLFQNVPERTAADARAFMERVLAEDAQDAEEALPAEAQTAAVAGS
jgi:pimeloyl-ACP methyl ester carboxylesterase